MTIVLPEQKVDITKPVTGVSVYDKIYAKDYNKTLEATRAGIAQEFDALAKEMEGMAGMMTQELGRKLDLKNHAVHLSLGQSGPPLSSL